AVRIERIVRDQNLFHATKFRRGLCNGIATGAGHQYMHRRAHLRGGGDGFRGRVLQGLVVVFGNDERSHQIAPISLSLSASSAAVFTLTPAVRFGGSTTL